MPTEEELEERLCEYIEKLQQEVRETLTFIREWKQKRIKDSKTGQNEAKGGEQE